MAVNVSSGQPVGALNSSEPGRSVEAAFVQAYTQLQDGVEDQGPAGSLTFQRLVVVGCGGCDGCGVACCSRSNGRNGRGETSHLQLVDFVFRVGHFFQVVPSD